MASTPGTDIEIIPAIDLRGGNCVRLRKGRFDEETLFHRDPLSAAQRLVRGARMLHVVDLDGAREGGGKNREIIKSLLAGLDTPIQCGGGVRHREDVAGLINLGVTRVVIGSLAVKKPEIVAGWLQHFGADKLVLALDARRDAKGVYHLVTQAWQATSATRLEDALVYYTERGAQHVLCTDVDRDGAMAGPGVELYREIRNNFPSLDLQASGGVRNKEDLAALANAGVKEVIVGRALLEGALVVDREECRQSA